MWLASMNISALPVSVCVLRDAVSALQLIIIRDSLQKKYIRQLEIRLFDDSNEKHMMFEIVRSL